MLIVDGFDSQKDADAVVNAANKLIQRIGLLADLYGSRCGAPHSMVVGGPDAWLMPPAFSATLENGRAGIA
ncbi:MAG: hypothetical protein IH617_13430 [Hydrogenophaga sp.]|nr:hypothetical protein [Hydrogenophaga sp.]